MTPGAIGWTVFDIMPFHGGLIMIHLISAHTGHFPAKTFSGTVWLLQIRREDGWTTLTVTGLSAIPVRTPGKLK